MPIKQLLGHVSSKQVREQFSQVSHWLDASFLYGSTESANRAVRNFYQGQVSFLDVDTGIHNYQKAPIIKQILPSLTDSESGPFACPAGASTAAHSNPGGCFLAGDERVNQQPLTASLHVLFLRFHNALARAMGGMMGDMGAGLLDEEIFQQARKIVIAVWQNIVYREFLPVLLGPQATADSLYSQAGLELEPLDFGYFLGYDASSNPNVLNEFTTAAFRLHTIMDDSVPRLLFVTGLTEDNPLSTQFNNMTLLYQEGNADAIISGMLEEMALAFDSQMAGELQGKLFRGQHPFGLDLMAIDIQRGRDHGLSSYNEVRKSCGFRRARDFSELSDFMPYHHTKILQQLYRTVEDVDLMVGGLLENVVNEEATVGPTFACIIAMEFRNKRLGDRFWYENPQQFDGGKISDLAECRNKTIQPETVLWDE